jgi:peptidoglycan/LPS O-acetylase OafA/YrhL
MAHTNQSSPASKFRLDIEGLRGIAVLVVVAFHCNLPWFSGGFIGVDVFFVLSGYLITGLLVMEIEKRSKLNLLEFYARRLRRLLPASALTLITTLIVSTAVLAPQELTFAGRASRATAIYLSNVFFAVNAADYFSQDVESNPMLHTWSLAVEEQFYLFWPLLIMAAFSLSKSRKTLLTVLFALTLLSLMVSLWYSTRNNTFAFYQLPARAWEFGIGGLASQIPASIKKIQSKWWGLAGWTGLLGVLGSVYFITDSTNFPGWIALVPVLGTTLLLVVGSQVSHGGPDRLLKLFPMQILGKLSYSWYLWHWPFLVIGVALIPGITIFGRALLCISALAVAALTHFFIENPIRFHPRLLKHPGRSFVLGIVLTALSLLVSFMSISFSGQLANRPDMKAISAAVEDIGRISRADCVTSADSSEVRTCSYGKNDASTHIVLFGDSHAIQWFNPMQTLANLRQWKLTTVLKSGCPATDIEVPNTSKASAQYCSQWRAEAIKKVISLNPSLVVIGNASRYIENLDSPRRQFGVSFKEWEAGTKRTLQNLSNAGVHVTLIRDNPWFTFDIPSCLARAARNTWFSEGNCGMPQHLVLDQARFEAEKNSALGLPNIRFIDLTEKICESGICSGKRNGIIVYRDDNHLTGSFAESMLPFLEAEMTPMFRPVQAHSKNKAEDQPRAPL